MSDLSRYLAEAKGDRSIDTIAEQATKSGHPISRSAVAKYLQGKHGTRPPEETLQGLAAGFGVDVRRLRELVGRPAGELGPFEVTSLADSLTQEQRDAINNLIKAFVQEGGQRDAGQAEVQKNDDETSAERGRRQRDVLRAEGFVKRYRRELQRGEISEQTHGDRMSELRKMFDDAIVDKAIDLDQRRARLTRSSEGEGATVRRLNPKRQRMLEDAQEMEKAAYMGESDDES